MRSAPRASPVLVGLRRPTSVSVKSPEKGKSDRKDNSDIISVCCDVILSAEKAVDRSARDICHSRKTSCNSEDHVSIKHRQPSLQTWRAVTEPEYLCEMLKILNAQRMVCCPTESRNLRQYLSVLLMQHSVRSIIPTLRSGYTRATVHRSWLMRIRSSHTPPDTLTLTTLLPFLDLDLRPLFALLSASLKNLRLDRS